MAIYRGNVRRNFLKTQQKLRRQYEEAGMTEEQINALYEYDLCQMNRDISFAMHTIPLQSVVENSESSDTSYNRKLAEAFAVQQTPSMTSRFWWLEEIDNPALVAGLMEMSVAELTLIDCLAFSDLTQHETSELLGITQGRVSQQMSVIRKKLKGRHSVNLQVCGSLDMKSATVRANTLEGYQQAMQRHILNQIGDRFIDEITADDLKLLMVPVAQKSKSVYGTVNMLLKCVFYSALASGVIKENPAADINPRGGKKGKERDTLSDQQVSTLLETIKGLPPYPFVMIGLYAGLRREEILALQWDCVFLDEAVPYIAVRRAWRTVKNRPEISTTLKTPAARRDIPIPELLVNCLREEKAKSVSNFVIADSKGQPLAESQFKRVWQYIHTRSVKARIQYRYINGEPIHSTYAPKAGQRCKTKKSIVYTLDFDVTPHQLRHTYITNLIYSGVDPKTVQYLAGHENSKVTMDIYAKVKYNQPKELSKVVNQAFTK